MEDELRLFLLLGGTVFIIGVLAHGIWKIRKNSKPEEKTRLEPRQWAEDDVFEKNGAGSDLDEASGGSKHQEGFDELALRARAEVFRYSLVLLMQPLLRNFEIV